ncbi:MAG TPA: FAD-binding oxidoreductase [Gemmatimonadota bacterium]|nr:FAD-binding oxidoreductase [Gemmatimonadota bacterium]
MNDRDGDRPSLRVEALETSVRGSVLLPGDPAYDGARELWNGRIDRRPLAVVRCLDRADVTAVLEHVRRHGVPVSIRGGGHHVAGFALCDDGVVIDLSMMDDVEVDPDERTARVGPGVRARTLNAATQPFGLATTAAPIVSCGMAGYTLGGGLGWISRKCGLACDNLLEAEMVTADGRTVRASSDENSDLFWALRGGGGNFGIVTEFLFRLHPVGPEVLSGQVVHPMSGAAEALRFYRDYMPTAPDELSCMPVVFRLPDVPEMPERHRGDTVFAFVPFFDGDPEAGMEAIRPLREVGSPIIDQVGAASYAHLLDDLESSMYFPGERNAYETAFFDEFSDAAIDAFVEHAAPVPSPNSSIFLEWLGGAIRRVDRDATAYPHRERRMCLTAVPKWANPEDDAEMIGWATRLFDALRPHAAPGRYVNYLDDRDAARVAVRNAYGSHYERLARIKARWDPDNLFRANHNIPPAA